MNLTSLEDEFILNNSPHSPLPTFALRLWFPRTVAIRQTSKLLQEETAAETHCHTAWSRDRDRERDGQKEPEGMKQA